MSGILLCSICEENREILTKLYEEIYQKLGKSCKGKNEQLAHLACSKCHSLEKIINLNEFCQLNSDKDGNYKIEWIDNNPHQDMLKIINCYKATIEEFEVNRLFDDEYVYLTTRILHCKKCNHKKFSSTRV